MLCTIFLFLVSGSCLRHHICAGAAAADGADRGNVGTAPYSGWKRPSGRTRQGTQAPPYRDLAPQDTRGIP